MANDNGWEVVSTGQTQDDGGWNVVAAKAAPGQASVSPYKRSLRERFKDNFEEGQRSSLLGAGAQAAAVNSGLDDSGYYKEKLKDDAQAYQMRSEADPWYKADGGIIGKAEAGLATLGGNLAGGLLSPETLAGGPGKTAAARVVIGGAVNAATDIPVQALQDAAGTHEGFDPWRVVSAGVTGGLIQGGAEGAHALGKAAKPVVKDIIGRVGEAANDLKNKIVDGIDHFGDNPVPTRDLDNGWGVVDSTAPQPTPKAAPPRQPSVDDVWGKLVHQESGGAQVGKDGQLIRSNKGAGGVAQLMPATARDVANRLGKPELADLAFQPTPEGRAANETLGRTYYSELLDRYGGDHELAAAAYNAGPGRVDKAVKAFGRDGFLDGLPTETQNYVRNVVGAGAKRQVRYSGEPVTSGDTEATIAANEAAQAAEDAARSARNAARQTADGGGAESVGGSPEADTAAPHAPQRDAALNGHIDDKHARLYDLGKRAEAGDVDLEAARQLGQDMAPFMDWTDAREGWAKREKRIQRQTGQVAPQRMIEAAKDYAAEFDAHGPEAKTSFYDPDRLHDVIAAGRQANPIPAEPIRPAPEPVAAPARDLTDHALDLMRQGKSVRVNRGPSLLEYLQSHGLRDEGGELSNIDLGQWHRDKAFRRRLIRDDGLSLEDAAVRAQEAGYLPERFGDGVDTRATPHDLIHAMREELAGRPRHAIENLEAQALRDHIDDLDQITNELGLNIDEMSNADIKAAISRAFSAPEPVARPTAIAALEAPPEPKLSDAMLRYRDRTAPEGVLQSSRRGGLPHQRVPDAIPADQGVPYSGRTIGDMMHDLSVALDLTHRRGRLQGGRSLGEYGTKSGVIRTKHADDLDVLVHEAAHAVEFTHKLPTLEAAMKKHEKLLSTFDYDPMQGRRHEGFAEWMRWYVTNPEVARKMAPDFYTDFETAMAKDKPKALAVMQGIQRDWDNYLKAGSLEVGKADLAMTGEKGGIAKARQTVKEQGLGNTLSRVFDRAYTWFVDDLHPLQQAEKQLASIHEHHTGKALEIKGAKSPYVLARLSREAFQAGRVDALHGVVPYRGVDPEGPTLGDAITKVFGEKWTDDALDGFDVYLASRRMVHEWDRFTKGELTRPPDKFSKAVHQQRIADFEAAHPKAREGAETVYEWVGNLWRKEFEAGFLTQQQYEAGLKKPDYVPLMRDVSDIKKGGAPNRPLKSDGKSAGGVKRFGGSRRAVVSPVTSMIKRAYELNVNIRRNEVIRTLDALAEKAGPGAGAIIERLPPKEIEAYQVDALAALEKAVKERGLLSDVDATTLMAAADMGLDGDGKTTMFRRRDTVAKPGETVVFHWKDGKKVPLMLADGEFGRELFTAISGMDREMRNGLVDFMSAFSSVLRHGVTLSPEFIGANIVRDQLATWINTDVGYKPGLSYLAGAAEQISDGVMAKRYQAIGGMKGGVNTAALTKPLPRTDRLARRQRMDLNKSNYRLRTYRLNQNPLHLAAALTDISETGSRLGVFKLAFQKAKRAGLSDYEAAVQAGITSRDYLDFGRRGSKMLTAVRLVTFLNASIQSMDKAARVLNASGYDRASLAGLKRVLAPIGKGAPKTAAEKAAVAHAWKAMMRIGIITAFGAGLAAIYSDDKEFQELNDQQRSTNWWFKAAGHWWRIPKPFELATPSNIAERMMENRITHDPTALERIWSDLAYTVAPPTGVPAVTVPLEIMRNRDNFGRPIVPDYLKGSVDPELQYNAYTSKLSKALGRALHTSPAVLDHIVTGYLGTLGRYALQGSDLAIEGATGAPRTAVGPEDAFFTRRFSGDPMRGSKSQGRFWDLVSKDGGEFTRAEGTFRQFMREGDDAQATAYLNKLKPEERAYVLAKVFSEDGSSKLHPMVRAQESVKVLNDIRTELRDGSLTQLNGKALSLTPEQRKQADDALTAMITAEMRNALVAIGEKGWAQKEMISRRDPKAELGSLGLLPIVQGRQQMAKVPPAGAVLRLWQTQRRAFEAPTDPGVLAQLMQHARLKSSDPETKRREIVKHLQGASQ